MKVCTKISGLCTQQLSSYFGKKLKMPTCSWHQSKIIIVMIIFSYTHLYPPHYRHQLHHYQHHIYLLLIFLLFLLLIFISVCIIIFLCHQCVIKRGLHAESLKVTFILLIKAAISEWRPVTDVFGPHWIETPHCGKEVDDSNNRKSKHNSLMLKRRI